VIQSSAKISDIMSGRISGGDPALWQHWNSPAAVDFGRGDKVEILIRPGAEVTDTLGRTSADAMICGLQLIPEE
jgi:hypothetical protein